VSALALRKEKLMKSATILSLSLLLVFGSQPLRSRAQQKPEDLAQKSAETWLALTDSAKYGESWDQASSGFKNAVTRDSWISKLESVRTPLGKVQSRKLSTAKYLKNPPNIPEGEYVVLQFNTSFEQLPSAVESVSTVLDKDGKWRVAGYFINPA
jgi:Protein of unknown function (DUF4019)